MSTSFAMHPNPELLGQHQDRLWCATKLQCGHAGERLYDALVRLGTTPGMSARAFAHAGEDDEERIPRTDDKLGYRAIVTVAQLLAVDWDPLAFDPDGRRTKRAARAYLATLPHDSLVLIALDS
jgi:hypothetical protein